MKTFNKSLDDVVAAVITELYSARRKHPRWPDIGQSGGVLRAAAIVSEESGELMRAAVQHDGEGGSLEACDHEALQTAAMGIRFLLRG